jgi:ERCC4-type nuclease
MKAEVYIDSREQDKIQKLIQYWEKFKDKYFQHIESIEIKTLATGDLCTSEGLFGVERKSAADFIGSICSGKLKQQLYELKQNFENAILFVEDYDGIMDCIEKTPQIHPNVIIGATASTFAHSKVPICYVGAFYIPVVLTTIEKFYDEKEQTYTPLRSQHKPSRKKATKEDFQKYIVKGLPNIGNTEGEKLLQHYDYSVYKLVRGIVENNEELLNIKGFGKKTIENIKEVLE